MILAKRLRGRAIATFLGPAGEAARDLATTVRGKLRRDTSDTLDFYFDLADPWSFLAAQVAQRLVAAYDVPLGFHYISAPATDVNPQPLMRLSHGVRDAKELAGYYNLDFPGKKELDPGVLRRIGAALIVDRPATELLAAALELTDLLWRNDQTAMPLALGKHAQESQITIPTVTAANYVELRKRGHYQGAMLSYRGRWYSAVDRLGYLEAALAEARGVPVVGVVQPRPESERGPLRMAKGNGPVPVELWYSFRSPYSYLALERIEETLRGLPATLTLRPIAPMIARGMPLAPAKRMYIARDTKREADRLGIPFGNLCDPAGRAVDNCLAIAPLAAAEGKALPFARSVMRGVWAEARDLTEYVDLRRVVERAGLSWDAAKAALGDKTGAAEAVTAAEDLAVIGLWGVPSMRAGDFVAWGQDRLPLLADRLRRHALAVAAEPAPDAAPPAA